MLIIHNPALDLPRPPVTRPGVVTHTQKTMQLMRALRRWKKAGFRIAPKKDRQERASICDVCPHYSAKGNLGLGECRAPGCGCTRAKVWLASESCPLKKWLSISRSPVNTKTTK